ncbi:DNA recombination protein RmuC [Thiomicrorhabdus arctica]|jgi:DNA recombination protein RmuC|uniref:DNA recombination protein RmuC n=1 Tax=Thiomicrorhabdus arctica TaxID=131540 RepID=UPI00035ED25C|nr:DNA recombination protein RmuC [Thiomicrorhabdus arctica]
MIPIEFHLPLIMMLFIFSILIAYLVVHANQFKRALKASQDALRLSHEATIRAEFSVNQLAKIEQENLELSTQLLVLQSLKGSSEQLQRQVQTLQEQLTDRDQQLEIERAKLSQSTAKSAELTVALEMEKSAYHEKIALLESAKTELSNEFKVLANQIFESKQAQFTQHSQSTIDAMLKPMQGTLEAFKSRVELVHKEDLEGRASLTEQLKQLHSLNNQMSEDTHNLTRALKGDSKTQGNWGELILERLLERSGLTEGVEFDREKSFTDNSGKRLRPDVIINLPDNKHIVIDSKVSLLHYESTLNSENEPKKTSALKSHLQSLKNHIDVLASKRYEHLEQLNAPDFVLMFVPVEGAYLMAIEADPSIFEMAFEKRVAVVTPTTLFTTLKTIEQLWRYERQSENTLKLIKRAAEVHDKFVGFVESFEKVGKQLQTAQTSYDSARKQMISGQGNLVRQAEMLKDLAGKTKKEIPAHLLSEAEGSSLSQLSNDS